MRALILVGTAAALSIVGAQGAIAQVFGPPSTVYGSIADGAGPVPDGVPFEIYIGETVCGKGTTQFYGEGDSRVTVYAADVVSREQTPGCGFDGAEMTVKVGDRLADDTAPWRQGPVQLDLTFGDAAPAPIPTATPAPRGSTDNQTGNPTSQGNGNAPTEPAGGASNAQGTPRPGQTTLPGSLSGSQPQASVPADDGSGGFPIWAALILALGGVAAVGGGVGFAMSRSAARNGPDNDGNFDFDDTDSDSDSPGL